MRVCSGCEKIATKQTERGKDSQKAGGLPQNDGWYCEDCWNEGVEIENEAMYGDCLYGCKC